MRDDTWGPSIPEPIPLSRFGSHNADRGTDCQHREWVRGASSCSGLPKITRYAKLEVANHGSDRHDLVFGIFDMSLDLHPGAKGPFSQGQGIQPQLGSGSCGQGSTGFHALVSRIWHG